MEAKAFSFSIQNRPTKRRKHNKAEESKPKCCKSGISPDLIFDIFTRLSVKSLVRFRCLNKLCSTIMADPYFTAVYQPNPHPEPGLLITCPTKLQLAQIFFSVGLNGGLATHCLTVPPRYSRYTTQSINGIVCMDFGLCATICNPSIRRAITLPLVCPKNSPAASATDCCVNSLGYDPISKQYKVLNSWRNFSTDKTEYRIFTLGTQSWRLLPDGPPYSPYRESIYVNGIIYFRSWVNLITYGTTMVAFDVHHECFSEIKLPNGISNYRNINRSYLIKLEGLLAIVEIQLDNENRLSIWMLEDHENKVWVQHRLPLPSYWKEVNSSYFAVCTIGTGEILLAPHFISNPFYLFYYDIQTSHLRWVQISGLPDYDNVDISRNAVTVTNYEENILLMAS